MSWENMRDVFERPQLVLNAVQQGGTLARSWEEEDREKAEA